MSMPASPPESQPRQATAHECERAQAAEAARRRHCGPSAESPECVCEAPTREEEKAQLKRDRAWLAGPPPRDDPPLARFHRKARRTQKFVNRAVRLRMSPFSSSSTIRAEEAL